MSFFALFFIKKVVDLYLNLVIIYLLTDFYG